MLTADVCPVYGSVTHDYELTEREIAVASLLGRRWTVKAIAAELGVGTRRVHRLVTQVAVKIGVPDGVDDHIAIGDWWRARPNSHRSAA